MESLNLTESERELFSDLFSSLDAETEGHVSLQATVDLISHCDLTHDEIDKIMELCGAKRLGHCGRSQFYIAMKLVACAQTGITPNTDALVNARNIPLPTFNCSTQRAIKSKKIIQQFFGEPQANNKQGSVQRANESCQLPPPPPTKGNRQRYGSVKGVDTASSPVHQMTSVKNFTQESCDHSLSSSVEVLQSPNSDILVNNENNWTPLNNISLCWRYCEEEHHLLDNDDNSAHSSNDEDYSDIWTINSEQKEYYIKQFQSLELDSDSKLSGRVAKDFFEKSKLAQSELSKIWKLSDVDKDGALTCEEFCTAMHLVVLRRNNVDLPEFLPVTSIIHETEKNSCVTPSADIPDTLSPQSKQWTKFTDSPVNNITISSPPNSSTSSSIGLMQPANFDFNAASIERDPKILHPVALRVSPDGQRVPYISSDSLIGTNCTSLSSELFPSGSSLGLSSNYCIPRKDPPPPPPRPVRNRGHTRSSSLDLNRLGKAHTNVAHSLPQAINNGALSPSLSSTVTTLEHRGAFTVYRKAEPFRSANNWVEVLKLKYPLPAAVPMYSDSNDTLELTRTLRSLQQRNFYLESIYSDLVQELANALETNSSLEAKVRQLVALK